MGGRGGRSGFASNLIASFEHANYRKSSEYGLLITADGAVMQFSGSEHHVKGTEELLDRMAGGVFTHNHPAGVTFSDDDIVNGIVKGNLKELRAVTPLGETHSLKNMGATLEERRKFFAEFQQVRMKASNVANAKIRRGESINKLQYVSSRLEKYMQENAQKFHMDYKKQLR